MSIDFHPIIQSLREGGVILHRPDTIWGLSCDATQPDAVKRIDELKQRSDMKSYVVLVSNEAMLERYVQTVPEVAYDLIEASITPLTIVYPGGIGLAENAMAQDGSIAIRVVKDKLTHDIIYRLRRPIISTSANISGAPAPLQLQDVPNEISSKVAQTIERSDAPQYTKASSIIKLALNGEFTFIRP